MPKPTSLSLNISNQGDITTPTKIVYKGKDLGKTKLYKIAGTMWKYGWSIQSNVFQEKYAVVFTGDLENYGNPMARCSRLY